MFLFYLTIYNKNETMLFKDKLNVVVERGMKRGYYGKNLRYLKLKNTLLNSVKPTEEEEPIGKEIDPEIVDQTNP